jgi:PPP family 3-phenylpropionic acid transporter
MTSGAPPSAPSPGNDVSRGYVRSFGLRVAAYFGFYLGLNGLYLPFFPLWLAYRGFDADEIATCLGVTQLLRIVCQPSASGLANRFAHRRTAVTLFSGLALMIFLPSNFVSGFAAIATVAIAAAVSWNMALPPIEALAMTGTRQFALDYGRMRLVGSAGFIVSGLVGGAVIERGGPAAIYWMLVLVMLAGLAMSLALPVTPAAIRQRDDASMPKARPMRELLHRKSLVALMIANALVQASHAIVYGFGSIFWESLAFSKEQIGVLWAVGVFAEISLFAFSGRLGRKFGAHGLLLMGTGGAALRWTLFPFEPGFAGYFLLQILHGLSFGASFLGLQRAVIAMVPERDTTSAQGLAYMLNAFSLAIATFAAGPLYRHFGGNAFWVMLVPVLLSFALLVTPTARRSRLEA